MKPQLKVAISPVTGLPTAEVPEQSVWDLVEYLSYHRVKVSYSFDSRIFIVVFHHCDCAAAQKMLDGWTHLSSVEAQSA